MLNTSFMLYKKFSIFVPNFLFIFSTKISLHLFLPLLHLVRPPVNILFLHTYLKKLKISNGESAVNQRCVPEEVQSG